MTERDWPGNGSGPPYLLIIGVGFLVAECLLLAGAPALGMTMHGALLLVAMTQFSVSRKPSRESLVVALLPMTRLVALVIPVDATAPALSYALVGGPPLIATLMVTREVAPEVVRTMLGRPRRIGTQIRLTGLGLPVGLLMLQVATGARLTVENNPLLGPIVIVVFVVLFEEVLFRGLIQRVTALRSPVLGLFVPNALYAAMYLGSGSAATVAAMASVGLIFSFCVMRTNSLWGVIGAHAIGRIIASLG